MRPTSRVCGPKALKKPLPTRKSTSHEDFRTLTSSSGSFTNHSTQLGASSSLMAFCANIWTSSFKRKYSTVSQLQKKTPVRGDTLPRVHVPFPSNLFDAFDEKISSVNLTELESPTLNLVDAEWSFPSSDQLKYRVRENAALHLLSPDDDYRRALELWCMTAIISSGYLSFSDCRNYIRTCLEVANPYLALKLTKMFSDRGIRCNRHIPRLFFANNYFKECVESLKYVDKKDWEHTVESLAAVSNTMELPRVRAFVLEGILRQFGEAAISERAMRFFFLMISRVEHLNQVGEYTRRWADLKLLSVRRLMTLRLMSLAFHRRFDEIVTLFEMLSRQGMLGQDVFQPSDYKYVVEGFMASRPASLAPLVDHISAFSTIVKPTAESLELLIQSLLESKHVATDPERASNFTRALALFEWLIAMKDSPNLELWIALIRNAPAEQFAEVVSNTMNHMLSAAEINLPASVIPEIAKNILIESQNREHSVDLAQLSEVIEKHQGDSSALWPLVFRRLWTGREKMEAIEAAEERYGDAGLPNVILSEVISYLMGKSAYEKVFELVQRALLGGRSLGEPSDPIWKNYIIACEILGRAEVIAEFIHPGEADQQGTTLAQRIRSFANMGLYDLLQETLDSTSEHMRSNPLVQSAFEEVEFQLERLQTM